MPLRNYTLTRSIGQFSSSSWGSVPKGEFQTPISPCSSTLPSFLGSDMYTRYPFSSSSLMFFHFASILLFFLQERLLVIYYLHPCSENVQLVSFSIPVEMQLKSSWYRQCHPHSADLNSWTFVHAKQHCTTVTASIDDQVLENVSNGVTWLQL